MWDQGSAVSLNRLEHVREEKGISLPDEIKGDYLNWKGN
jgi:hypothetical protein